MITALLTTASATLAVVALLRRLRIRRRANITLFSMEAARRRHALRQAPMTIDSERERVRREMVMGVQS